LANIVNFERHAALSSAADAPVGLRIAGDHAARRLLEFFAATTNLYNRTSDAITLDEVERVRILWLTGELAAAAAADLDARPMTEQFQCARKIPLARTLRRALGLTQEEFAGLREAWKYEQCLAAAFDTAKSGGVIMAAITHVFTISYVANLLGEGILGFLAIIRASHDPAGAPRLAAHRTTAIAPMISCRLRSRCPILEMRPSPALPPEEFCRGVSPSQAAKSRPRAKVSGGGASASSALAQTGPVPGMRIRRRALSSSRARSRTFTNGGAVTDTPAQRVARSRRHPTLRIACERLLTGAEWA
jgi:hypothetical protein